MTTTAPVPIAVSTAPYPVVRRLPLPRRVPASVVTTLDEGPRFAQGALALRYVSDPPSGPAQAHGRRRGTPAAADPLDAWAGSLVQAVVEVVAGDRPIAQLVRWTTRRVYADIAEQQRAASVIRTAAAAAGPGRSGPRRQKVASLRVFRPAPTVAEVSARVTCGVRSRAVAARLDLVRGRWVCTTLLIG